MRKIGLTLLCVLIASTAFAGGSIFGGHKHKSVNTNGVYAIGVHICSSLECPPIRIVEGKCDGENMSKHWGVCVCDKGYMPQGTECIACPKGQYSDGINACQDCPEGMYAEAGDTSCTDCPPPMETICNGEPAKNEHNCPTQVYETCSGATPFCATDNVTCVECLSDAHCSTGTPVCNSEGVCESCPSITETICAGTPEVDGHNCPTQELVACTGETPVCGTDNKNCICPPNANCNVTPWVCTGNTYRTGDTCETCPDANALSCNGAGKSTSCKTDYLLDEVNGICYKNLCKDVVLNQCQESCDPKTGNVTNKVDAPCKTDLSLEGNNGTCNASGECIATLTCDINPATDCISGALVDGQCACAPADDGATCTSWTNNECGQGKYCVFNPTGCGDDDYGTGTCQPVGYIGEYRTETVNDHEYTMSDCSNCPNWWSAQSWCKAFDKTMVSLEDIHCNSDGCTDTLWQDLGNTLYQYPTWTTDMYDSCYAFNVYLANGGVYFNYRNYYYNSDVLCKGNSVTEPPGPTCPGNSSATEITNGTSFEVTESGESITCWCPEGQSYQSTGCADVPTTPCNDYENNVCGLGYYCQASSPSCTEGGDGTCIKISSANNNEGTKTAGGYWVRSDVYMDWFSTNSWCIGKGRPGLIRLSTLNIALPDDEVLSYCDFPDSEDYPGDVEYRGEVAACKTVDGIMMTPEPDNDYAHYWATLQGQIGSDYYWTRDVWTSDSCIAWILYLGYGFVYNDFRNDGYNYALCE